LWCECMYRCIFGFRCWGVCVFVSFCAFCVGHVVAWSYASSTASNGRACSVYFSCVPRRHWLRRHSRGYTQAPLTCSQMCVVPLSSGRTHAREALAQKGQLLGAPRGSCHTCQLPGCVRPVFVDPKTARVHEFCSRGHAQKAIQRNLHPVPAANAAGRLLPGVGAAAGAAQGAYDDCSYPECDKQRFTDARGVQHDFCGRTHAVKATEVGSLLAPPTIQRVPALLDFPPPLCSNSQQRCPQLLTTASGASRRRRVPELDWHPSDPHHYL